MGSSGRGSGYARLPVLRAIIVALLAATLASACGAAGAEPRGTARGKAEQLLDDRAIERYAEPSPQRALLAWWRAAQFASRIDYLDAFTVQARERIERDLRLDEALVYFSGSIRTVRPRIVGVDKKGSNATVYALIEYRQPVGTRRFVATTVPRSFSMAMQYREWRLTGDEFVQESLPDSLRRKRA